MIQIVIAIIMALISAVTAKKKGGANNAQAAAVGAAAGLGTYYVATQTEWGQGAVSSLEGTLGLTPANAGKQVEVTQPDGTKTMVTVAEDQSGVADGQVKLVGPDGTTKTVTIPGVTNTGTPKATTIWDTLSSWGPVGTAAVVGTTGAVTSSSWSKYWPWIAAGAAILLLTR